MIQLESVENEPFVGYDIGRQVNETKPAKISDFVGLGDSWLAFPISACEEKVNAAAERFIVTLCSVHRANGDEIIGDHQNPELLVAFANRGVEHRLARLDMSRGGVSLVTVHVAGTLA